MRIGLHLRLLFAAGLIAALGAWVLAREHRPSLLRPDLRLYAYVGNIGDGTLSVIDIAALRNIATVDVGPAPSGLRAHPTRDEIWGVSTTGGFVWVLDTRSGTVAERIPVGLGGFALDFSPDGTRAYVAASRAGKVSLVDCATRRVIASAVTGRSPWIATVSPDGALVVVSNRDDHTVSLLDAATLASLAVVPVAARPEQVVILPDGSKAFVSAAGEGQISVLDLRRKLLLANLPIGAPVADFMLKPDGGELFVSSPARHSLSIVNTWTNEIAEDLLVGNQPTQGTLAGDGPLYTLFLSDAATGHIHPIVTGLRRLLPPITAGQQPGTSRLTPDEDLLLVVNEQSQDLAVIRTRTQGLLTLIPVGPQPRDLAIKLFSAR